MKKFILLLIIPFFSFTQSGDTNGDGFTNLEDLFNVLDDWLQNVNDNDPEAISNLDEMTNLVDSLITLNQNVNYGISIEGWIEHSYEATWCCTGGCASLDITWPSCTDSPIVNVASKSGILSYDQNESFCNNITVIVNGTEIINNDNVNYRKHISFPIKKGDEFIIYDVCYASGSDENGITNNESNYVNESIHFFSFGDGNVPNTNQSNSNNDTNNLQLLIDSLENELNVLTNTVNYLNTQNELISTIIGCVDDNTACNFNESAIIIEECTYPTPPYNCDGINIGYQLGDFAHGGIIFYLDETGDSGLVVSNESLGEAPWGCQGLNINTSASFGDGLQNTLNITESCDEEDSAANICYNANINGYDDWYLPSNEELSQLANFLSTYNNYDNFLGYLESVDCYNNIIMWSSSAVSDQPDFAWVYYYCFLEYLQVNLSNSFKSDNRTIAAIRSF